MRKVIFGLIILVFLGYFVYEGRGLFLAPSLTLFSPPENLITAERNIELSGQTEPGVRLTINGTPLLPDEDGFFQKTIMLDKGLNTLEIQATKRYARPKIIQRKILVTLKDSAISLQRSSL